jgi:MFS family permease
MYPIENSGDLIKKKRKNLYSREPWQNVGRGVFLLGLTSLFTDISSEMVTTTLPLYLLVTLRLAPLQFGLIDGINQGASVLVRIASGLIADRWQRLKEVATAGYVFSAICRLGLLLVGNNWLALSGVVLFDRIGKGIRTSPRDALIAASAKSENLGTAFGVHRAMDTAGAMLGPLIAAALLAFAPGAYDAVFIVSLCFAIVGVAVIALLFEKPITTVSADSPSVSSRVVSQLLSRPDFRMLVLVSSGLALATISENFIYLTLQRQFNLSLSLFPLLYVGTALLYMVLAIPIGRLADKIGKWRVFVIGYGLLGIVYAILLIPNLSTVFGWSVLGFLGIYYAATDGVLIALASTILPEEWLTTGLAVMTTGTGLARLLASLVYGALWSAIGPGQALITFLIGLCVALLISWVFIGRVERNINERTK